MLYKKKRQIYNSANNKFKKVFWEDNVDESLLWALSDFKKKYSKAILPYKINGEVQHGWSQIMEL